MARTDLTVQAPTRAGLAVTLAAANVDGNAFSNNGRRHVRIKNGSGSPVTATFLFGKTIDGVATGEGRDVTVAAGAEVTTAVWPPDDYNQPTGKVHIDYSSVTTVTVAVVEV